MYGTLFSKESSLSRDVHIYLFPEPSSENLIPFQNAQTTSELDLRGAWTMSLALFEEQQL